MKRVVFFVQGKRVPAARARGFLVADALRADGIDVDVRVPYPSVYGDTDWGKYRRAFQPISAASQLANLRDLRADDLVYFQRPMTQLPTTRLERLAARGRKSVLDFDDAIFVSPIDRWKTKRLIELVDHVVTGNRYLAEATGCLAKATVIPTVVDAVKFAAQPPRDRVGKDVVIGWTGLASNYPQLAVAAIGIGDAIRATGAQLVVISNAPPPPELAAIGARYVPWQAASEVADLAQIDIGLMPLPDTPYTRGKCAFKQIQYMALARPGLASAVGANMEVVTDGVDGFLPRSQAEWSERLIQLVGDPDLRANIGTAARARVEAAYSIAAVLPLYRRVLESLA